MEMSFLYEKLSEIEAVINENLSYTGASALIIKLNKGFKPQEGDGDLIEVDEAGRLVKGKLGDRLNRIEEIINNSELHQERKTIIINYFEDIRLFYGKESNQD